MFWLFYITTVTSVVPVDIKISGKVFPYSIPIICDLLPFFYFSPFVQCVYILFIFITAISIMENGIKCNWYYNIIENIHIMINFPRFSRYILNFIEAISCFWYLLFSLWGYNFSFGQNDWDILNFYAFFLQFWDTGLHLKKW